MGFDVAGIGKKRPEKPAREWVDARIEIVNLRSRIGVANGTPGIKIESDEAGRASMHLTVHSQVDSIHEPAISIKDERRGSAQIEAGSGSSYVGAADDPVEVCNRRWFLSGRGQNDMELVTKRRETAGDRVR